jgi:hypothetical protein
MTSPPWVVESTHPQPCLSDSHHPEGKVNPGPPDEGSYGYLEVTHFLTPSPPNVQGLVPVTLLSMDPELKKGMKFDDQQTVESFVSPSGYSQTS